MKKILLFILISFGFNLGIYALNNDSRGVYITGYSNNNVSYYYRLGDKSIYPIPFPESASNLQADSLSEINQDIYICGTLMLSNERRAFYYKIGDNKIIVLKAFKEYYPMTIQGMFSYNNNIYIYGNYFLVNGNNHEYILYFNLTDYIPSYIPIPGNPVFSIASDIINYKDTIYFCGNYQDGDIKNNKMNAFYYKIGDNNIVKIDKSDNIKSLNFTGIAINDGALIFSGTFVDSNKLRHACYYTSSDDKVISLPINKKYNSTSNDIKNIDGKIYLSGTIEQNDVTYSYYYDLQDNKLVNIEDDNLDVTKIVQENNTILLGGTVKTDSVGWTACIYNTATKKTTILPYSNNTMIGFSDIIN
jgi:hypothetical protein